LPMAKDFSSFLSLEGATRKKSPLKSLIPLMHGDMISLGGGTVLFSPFFHTFFYYGICSCGAISKIGAREMHRSI
jgi:hypothetical protein